MTHHLTIRESGARHVAWCTCGLHFGAWTREQLDIRMEDHREDAAA